MVLAAHTSGIEAVSDALLAQQLKEAAVEDAAAFHLMPSLQSSVMATIGYQLWPYRSTKDSSSSPRACLSVPGMSSQS